jgi:hypothetical protein
MKTLKLFVFGLLFIATTQSQAQVSVNVNFGTPPVWAPADRVETQYYYLPEVDAYYDVPAQRFIYISNGGWIRSERLPARYSNYDLRGGRVVYLTDYRGNSPYVYHKKHKVKYVTTSYRQPKKVVYVKGDNGKHKGHGKGKKHKD